MTFQLPTHGFFMYTFAEDELQVGALHRSLEFPYLVNPQL